MLPAAPIVIPESEVDITAIRAQSAGGQNVNKVSSAVHLRFDIWASSLPDDVKERLLCLRDSRITDEGVLILKAQQHRTQEQNRQDALFRLHEIVNSVALPPRPRRPTKPTYGSKQRRLEGKSQRSQIKANCGARSAQGLRLIPFPWQRVSLSPCRAKARSGRGASSRIELSMRRRPEARSPAFSASPVAGMRPPESPPSRAPCRTGGCGWGTRRGCPAWGRATRAAVPPAARRAHPARPETPAGRSPPGRPVQRRGRCRRCWCAGAARTVTADVAAIGACERSRLSPPDHQA
jgi:ribosome-associated protein